MRVDLFDFQLPAERIATEPARPRESAKLLHVTPDTFTDHTIADLPRLLSPNDMLVFNDTRVIPARLWGRREGGEARIEVLLHQPVTAESGMVWKAFARPGKKLKPGDSVEFARDFSAQVIAKLPTGEVELRFAREGFWDMLHQYGEMPLPPYIDRPDGATKRDAEDYQTVYAARPGAVAAPTAGLHFTSELLAQLEAAGIPHCFVTLHVGAGTFQPVKVEDTDQHVMHQEWGEVTADTAEAIRAWKTKGGNIVAVGTTSLRLLESATDEAGTIHPYNGNTGIFITPGYRFRMVDRLLTNFHLPKSTLFMLVSAFSGLDSMQEAYAYAIDKQYRFYSYGDACLLEKANVGAKAALTRIP